MTDREWHAVADELERMCDDFEQAKGADDSLLAECAAALVDRARMLIAIIRQEFQGN